MTRWIDVCALQDIAPLGACRVRRADSTQIAIFRAADDAVFALLDRCPHKGGPLSQGIVFGNRVACPLHNWTIELDHGTAVPPDAGCVERFAVAVRNGRVLLAPDAPLPPGASAQPVPIASCQGPA